MNFSYLNYGVIMKRFIISLFIMATFATNLFSEEDSQILKDLPKLLGINNAGKEFWFSIPPSYSADSEGYKNFIKIFVSSNVATNVTVEVPSKGYISKKTTEPNGVIGFDIDPQIAQTTLFNGRVDEPVPEKIYNQAGIHIKAEDPIIVYCVVRFKFSSDGFLAIPVASMGTEYIVSSYPDMVAMYSSSKAFPSITTITAPFDNTRVNFTLGGAIAGQTAGGMKPGETKEFIMQSGDVLVFMSKGPIGIEPDLSGSKIISDKPIAVVSGNHCANIPTTNRWCDYICEMEIPTYTWGKNYHVARTINRKFSQIVRLYGKENNTKIYRDGKGIGVIKKGGGTNGEGFIEMRINGLGNPPTSAVFHANKPFGVTFYNPGVAEDDASASDPFVMAITPIDQYQKEITFCTPAVQGGETFKLNYIACVYEANTDGSIPDELEFGKLVANNFTWQKFANMKGEIDELFLYDVEGKKYGYKVVSLPNDGVYKIKSDKPFACYSFGFSDYESYGYPTSSAYKDLMVKDIVKPQPSYYIDANGDVSGEVVDMPEDEKYRANLADLFLIPEKSINYKLEYDKFIPGTDRKVKWNLKVIDKSKTANALLLFNDRCGNDTVLVFNYTPTGLSDTKNQHPISIIPNPADKFIEISLDETSIEEGIDYSIIDVSGKIIINGKYENKSLKIDVSNLAIGEYMLLINSKSKSISKKLLISR